MKKTITRMCIACREHRSSDEMFRIAKFMNDDREIAIFDTEQKIQSRGAYICKNEKCLQLAQKSRAVERHLKCAPADDLFDVLKEQL